MKETREKVYPCNFAENNELAGYKRITKQMWLSNYPGIAISLAADPFDTNGTWILIKYTDYEKLPFIDEVDVILENK